MRDLLLVAQIVNVLTDGMPGGPVVRVIGERWTVAGRTGRTSACDTVRELWLAMLDHHGAGAASRIAERLAQGLPGASPLADRVLREGLEAANDVLGGAASS
ncbi:hypothetical protein IWX63_002485 [Arthrobacter sp. CAN_A2]|uniref:hypothetical protein n=1 Tax=Arthrobacter sp. CAN_A2 TaxID=2787718 RepID=UPI0018EF97C0